MIGVTLAGLAEGMALADRAGLQQKDVLEVSIRLSYIEQPSVASTVVVDSCKFLVSGALPSLLGKITLQPIFQNRFWFKVKNSYGVGDFLVLMRRFSLIHRTRNVCNLLLLYFLT